MARRAWLACSAASSIATSVEAPRVASNPARRRRATRPAGSAAEQDARPRRFSRNGYNFISQAKAGVVTWIASDLNSDELMQLADLL